MRPKIDLGAERPEPPELVQQRKRQAAMRSFIPGQKVNAGTVTAPVETLPPTVAEELHDQLPEEPAPEELPVSPEPPVVSPSLDLSLEQALQRWMEAQHAAKVKLTIGQLTVTITVVALVENNTNVTLFYDPKLVSFEHGAEAMTVVALKWEDRVRLSLGSREFEVVYAVEPLKPRGWPFCMLTLLKVGES